MDKFDIIEFIQNSLNIEESRNGKSSDLYKNLLNDLNNKQNDRLTLLSPPDSTSIYYIPFYIPAKNKISNYNRTPLIIFQTWPLRIVSKKMYTTVYNNLLIKL